MDFNALGYFRKLFIELFDFAAAASLQTCESH